MCDLYEEFHLDFVYLIVCMSQVMETIAVAATLISIIDLIARSILTLNDPRARAKEAEVTVSIFIKSASLYNDFSPKLSPHGAISSLMRLNPFFTPQD